MRRPPSPYERISGRFLLFWLAATALIGALVVLTIWPDFPTYHESLPEWVAGLITFGLLFAITLERARQAGLKLSDAFGHVPSGRRARELAVLAVPLYGIGLVTVYVSWLPLSLAAPGLTRAWLLEGSVDLYAAGPPFPWISNIVAFVVAVAVGPFVEEWFFRGLLLRRWTHKWGSVRGAVGSSLVFAVLHPDLFGAFLFGVAMCGMYAWSGSLWPPVIIHAAHNGLAWAIDVIHEHAGNPLAMDTLAHFQAAVWMPVVGLAMLLPWVRQARRHWRPMKDWTFNATEAVGN